MTEYRVERTEQVLTVRRTAAWLLSGAVGALFPVSMVVWMGHDLLTRPTDRFSLLVFLAVCGFMATILYKVLLYGRCLVFDRRNDRFLLDGRRVCALTELASIRMEAAPKFPAYPLLGRLLGLHLRTVSGRDIALSVAWESSSECGRLAALTRELADFVGPRRQTGDRN